MADSKEPRVIKQTAVRATLDNRKFMTKIRNELALQEKLEVIQPDKFLQRKINRDEAELKGEPHWAAVADKIKSFKDQGGPKAYEELSTSMMELMVLIFAFVRAMRESSFVPNMISEFMDTPILKSDYTIRGCISEVIDRGFESNLANQAKDIFFMGKLVKIDYHVGVDEEGRLLSTASFLGKRLNDEKQADFDTAVIFWLEKRGWDYVVAADPSEPGHFVSHTTGNVMTPEDFAELSTDDKLSLNAFLENCCKIKGKDRTIEPESPSPAP